MILYHGTSVEAALQISKSGFKTGKKYNWHVKSSKGFVFLSLAYAPFFAQMAKSKNNKERALIKCFVEETDLFPDDDFVMFALGKPIYTEKDLKDNSIWLYKDHYKESLKFLGNACALPPAIRVLGVASFSIKKLLYVCDPTITPINYQIMGDYYKKLTEWISEGNKPEEFKGDFF